jgi:hypothetical protein
MKGRILISIAVLLALFELTATAQIPRTLQIGITNGTATVSSQNSPGTFLGWLETTTNLSPPVVWSVMPLSQTLVSGVSNNFPVAGSQAYFRLLQSWPLFQFAIFYNVNLEFDSGSALTIGGPVYCNASIWFRGSITYFESSVTAAGSNSFDAIDPFSDPTNGYPGNTGTPVFDVAPVTGQSMLTLPIPGFNTSASSIQNILNLPPAGLAAPNPAYLQYSNQAYIFNVADLIVSNSASGINGNSYFGTNITIYYLNPYNDPYLTLIPPDLVYSNTTTHAVSNYYSFVTNVVFYDYRESDTVQALQINVTNLTRWLNTNVNYVYTNRVLQSKPAGGGQPWNSLNFSGSTDKGHPIDSIYVYNNVPETTSQLPAVRVVNGAQLPSSYGLTIATPQPLYVKGNYNVQTNSLNSDAGSADTSYTYPAALMADAITILSANYVDTATASIPSYYSRPAAATTVNAACLSGIAPTNPNIPNPTAGDYSGGVENYFRFLEDWGSAGTPMWFNGSIVCMFSSQYATNYYRYYPDPFAYYTQPARNWNFDTNFLNPIKLPPLTPTVSNFIRP